MRIRIATPSPRHGRTGNRVTAERWADLLRELGHDVHVVDVSWEGEAGDASSGSRSGGGAGPEETADADLLVALHARRSADLVRRFRERHPERPLIVALTGTDLYRDLPEDPDARDSLEAADRLVVLQEKAVEAVPASYRPRVRVIYQSVPELWERGAPLGPGGGDVPAGDDPGTVPFRVCQLAHLRPVKDPLRVAEAARRLPASSRIRVVHCGKALTDELEREAAREARENPRYEWRREVPREDALGVLAASDLLVLASRMEGAGNAISEALAADVPVLCSRVDGLVGMLGEDYPGYFPVGDTEALAALLLRAETDPAFYASLVEGCRRRASRVDPARERAAWADLLAELPAHREPSPTDSGEGA